MIADNEFHWLCPACSHTLVYQNKVWRCDNNHSFDAAKEGYVNLLLAQHRSSKAPGDSKAMVVARRSFLEQGHYRPLAEKVSELLLAHSATLSPLPERFSLFDAGCGEGYYLNHIVNALIEQGLSLKVSGIDISKPAIQKAAKLNKQIQFAVASTYQVPIVSHSEDAVIQIFAPSKSEEIRRILKPGGIWINVNPADGHLYELKQMVYDQPAKHTVETNEIIGFTEQSSYRVSFDIALTDPQQRENLLMMTPFYWSISTAKKQQVLEQLTRVNTDFMVTVYQHTGTP